MKAFVSAMMLAANMSPALAATITPASVESISAALKVTSALMNDIGAAEQPTVRALARSQSVSDRLKSTQDFICFEILAQNATNLMQYVSTTHKLAYINSLMRDPIDDGTSAAVLKIHLETLTSSMSPKASADTLADSCYANKDIRDSASRYKETFTYVEGIFAPIARRLGVKP